MNLFYSDVFVLPLPSHHRFPMGKYARLRDRLLGSGEFGTDDFGVPPGVTDAEIERVHCPGYVRRVACGALSPAEQKAIGFPWSERMVERSRRSCGATLAAAREALTRGWGANLAGGTHHAFRDRGEGFCVFNDAAIASRALQAEAGLTRIAVIDCDVHQGNGTAAIFAESSDLDVELADGTGDDEYLWHLERALDETLERSRPQLAFYLAGADPYEGDRLGRLKLTKAGLARRDEMVLGTLASRHIPVAIAMAGGYARDIEDSVDIHANTIRTARRILDVS